MVIENNSILQNYKETRIDSDFYSSEFTEIKTLDNTRHFIAKGTYHSFIIYIYLFKYADARTKALDLLGLKDKFINIYLDDLFGWIKNSRDEKINFFVENVQIIHLVKTKKFPVVLLHVTAETFNYDSKQYWIDSLRNYILNDEGGRSVLL